MSELDGLKLLRRIEEGVAGKTGEAFFRQIVCDLSRALNAHGAFTSRLLPNRRANMLAFWVGGAHEKCVDYALEGTPCEFVYRGEITSYARNVADVFPVDRAWFESLGVKSYLGIPVKGDNGEVCGHLAVVDTRERDWLDADVDILRLFSLRAAAEIERTHYQQELEEANSAFRQANEQLQQEIAQRLATEAQLADAKDAAESANRAKSAFISQMSHELRTPLNGILGYAQVLRRERSMTSAKLSDGLSVIERSGEHLLKLVNDLLDLARIESGRLDLAHDRVELRELIQHVADLTRVRAADAGLTFELQMDANSLSDVVSDERVIRQILLNLLGNALKFTEPGGRLSLRAQGDSHDANRYRVHFTVADTGVGIAEDQLARIFEPFHRVVSGKRVVEGTGLGLAITKRLVAALGGQLNVASTPGVGSSFAVEFDADAAKERPPALISPAEIESYSGARRKVLVADDDDTNRTLVGQLLESVGFEVHTVCNGFEAAQWVRGTQPDLIITDLVMPVMDGMALVCMLRAEERFRALPIVAMSASASSYTRQEALDAGCSAFLPKPLRLTNLLEEIGTQLGLKWNYREPEATRETVSAGEPAQPFALSPDLANELRHLALQGDILSLTALTREALAGNAAAQPFCAEIRSLAERYDIRGIRRVIESSQVR